MTSLLVRRTTLSIASVAVSALLVAVAVVPAEAHAIIELSGTPAYAGQASRLTMEIQHGCNPASKVPNVFPTTRVSAYFNSRFGTVTPRALKGWAVSRTVLARQEGLPKAVIEVAWNAQTRLHARYKHLTRVRHKKSTVAAAALGRELAGFIWAIGRMVQPRPLKPAASKP